MKKQIIEVALRPGLVEGDVLKIPALVEGHFAVHKRINLAGELGDGYSVTHIPDGMTVGTYTNRQKDAIGYLRELAAITEIDWSKAAPDGKASSLGITADMYLKKIRPLMNKYGF